MESVLLTARPDSVPPLVVMSEAAKPLGASLKVKVMVAVWPAIRLETSLVIARVGAVVSANVVSKLIDGLVPAPPVLPTASVYRPLETVMLAVPEFEAVGVKVAP